MKKTCPNGHTFYKTSECPTCPVCEKERKPTNSFLAVLAAPARRALENAGILTLEKLATYSEKEILSLHGMGKSSIPELQKVLAEKDLGFRGRD
ncbi:MAG: DNA-directed RNA polymerase subunit alpha C-terminal domain-containing protein [Cytophagaceae bacterium]